MICFWSSCSGVDFSLITGDKVIKRWVTAGTLTAVGQRVSVFGDTR